MTNQAPGQEPETVKGVLDAMKNADTVGEINELVFRLPGSVRKTATVICYEVESLLLAFGKNRLVFGTGTTGCKSTSMPRFKRWWAKRVERYFKSKFERLLYVFERHKDGRPHVHFIAVCDQDIGTGFNWGLFEQKKALGLRFKASEVGANLALASLWKFFREHGGGRFELTPIKKNGEAAAFYLASYLTKGEENRLMEDKGSRRVGYSGYTRMETVIKDGVSKKVRGSHRTASCQHSNAPYWETEPDLLRPGERRRVLVQGVPQYHGIMSEIFRAQIQVWASKVETKADGSLKTKIGLTSDELYVEKLLGPRWVFNNARDIMSTDARELLWKQGKFVAYNRELQVLAAQGFDCFCNGEHTEYWLERPNTAVEKAMQKHSLAVGNYMTELFKARAEGLPLPALPAPLVLPGGLAPCPSVGTVDGRPVFNPHEWLRARAEEEAALRGPPPLWLGIRGQRPLTAEEQGSGRPGWTNESLTGIPRPTSFPRWPRPLYPEDESWKPDEFYVKFTGNRVQTINERSD